MILRLARENSHGGYVRIAELRKLGITVSATLVRNVLARADVPPAPERLSCTWRAFLREHAETVLAADFFTLDSVWLQRLYVLFFVSIGTRKVEDIACTRKPDTPWVTQQARNLRALGRQRASRVPRPAADLRPPPARTLAQRLRPPLPPTAASSRARPTPARSQQGTRSFTNSDHRFAAGEAA